VTQEVAKRESREVVIPVVGQVLDLTGPLLDLGEALDDIRDIESQFRAAKRVISDAVLERMDFDSRYTFREGPFELRGDGPGRVEYDGAALAHVLAQLVDDGLISEDAAKAACEVVQTYKPKAAGIKNLLKRGGRIAEAIEKTAEPVPDERRRVSVKRVSQ
jgi:hypothetical protein